MVGEKWNHRRCRRQYVALEHGTCLHSCRVGDISSRCFTLPPWVWVISFDLSSAHCLVTMTSDPLMSNTAKSIVMPFVCSREVDLCKFQPSSVSHMILIHNKTLCSTVSCRWCGNHYGPPSIKVTSCRHQLIIQEVGLETPYGILEPACLNGRFVAFDERFSSWASDRVSLRCSTSTHLFARRRLYL